MNIRLFWDTVEIDYRYIIMLQRFKMLEAGRVLTYGNDHAIYAVVFHRFQDPQLTFGIIQTLPNQHIVLFCACKFLNSADRRREKSFGEVWKQDAYGKGLTLFE